MKFVIIGLRVLAKHCFAWRFWNVKKSIVNNIYTATVKAKVKHLLFIPIQDFEGKERTFKESPLE